jgi:ABC-type amino acid transport substrate-binding protein
MQAPRPLHSLRVQSLPLLLSLVCLGSLGQPPAVPAAAPAAAAPPSPATPLRVGAVTDSLPCSQRNSVRWQGLAIDLWQEVATLEQLPHKMSAWPSTAALLAATARGEVDVAVGCINISPERLRSFSFSLPFQEDGLAVMVARTRLDLSRAFFSSLFGRDLILLLGGFLSATALLSLLTWWLEHYGSRPETRSLGRRRSFMLLFQILTVGPGSNTVATSCRGNVLVIVAYLVRIVSASLLVGYLTVTVNREAQERLTLGMRSLADLDGLRVAVRPGTVSEALLRERNAAAALGVAPIRIVPFTALAEGRQLLAQRRADAVLADSQQLRWLIRNQPRDRFVARLALEGIRPESQAFAFSPRLAGPVQARIDLAISRLKREGVVTRLRDQALGSTDPTDP